MNDHSQYLAETLAMQILGQRGIDGRDPHRTPVESIVAPTLRVELGALVRGITRDIYLDNAAIARHVKEELERQVAELDFDAEIAKLCRKHLSDSLARLDDTIRKRVGERIAGELDRLMGNVPERIAKRLAAGVWDAAFEQAGEENPFAGSSFRPGRKKTKS